MQALVATLSGAMVGVMDGNGLVNRTRALQTCRADGLLLKPDRPATAVDACFTDHADPAECATTSTYADIPGHGRAWFLLAEEPGVTTSDSANSKLTDSSRTNVKLLVAL